MQLYSLILGQFLSIHQEWCNEFEKDGVVSLWGFLRPVSLSVLEGPPNTNNQDLRRKHFLIKRIYNLDIELGDFLLMFVEYCQAMASRVTGTYQGSSVRMNFHEWLIQTRGHLSKRNRRQTFRSAYYVCLC